MCLVLARTEYIIWSHLFTSFNYLTPYAYDTRTRTQTAKVTHISYLTDYNVHTSIQFKYLFNNFCDPPKIYTQDKQFGYTDADTLYTSDKNMRHKTA